jgi:hypothetical protein
VSFIRFEVVVTTPGSQPSTPLEARALFELALARLMPDEAQVEVELIESAGYTAAPKATA